MQNIGKLGKCDLTEGREARKHESADCLEKVMGPLRSLGNEEEMLVVVRKGDL